MTAKRIQRKRTKGYRTPMGAVYVGRPTVWGNPFIGPPAMAVAAYRDWLTGTEPAWRRAYPMVREAGTWCPEWRDPREVLRMAREHLRGRDLACWCPLDRPCHADVLLELANAEPGEDTPRAGSPGAVRDTVRQP